MDLTLEQLLGYARNNPDQRFDLNNPSTWLAACVVRQLTNSEQISVSFDNVIVNNRDRYWLPKAYRDWCEETVYNGVYNGGEAVIMTGKQILEELEDHVSIS